jgi:hypothetical protein
MKQVKFYQGDLTVYRTTPASYIDGVFFDTTNGAIWLDNQQYSTSKWSILEDASIIVGATGPYLSLSFDRSDNQVFPAIKLPTTVGNNSIVTWTDPSTGDVSVSISISDAGNTKTWLEDTSGGLKFNESVFDDVSINGKAILTSPWLTSGDISVGTIPTVNDTSLHDTDTVAEALVKIRQSVDEHIIKAIKRVYVYDSSDGSLFAFNEEGEPVEKLTLVEGSHIKLTNPEGDTDNTIVISTDLKAGTGIEIAADGTISAAEEFCWQEID